MRVTETTPLLGEPSSTHPRYDPGNPNYIFCPHAPSHRFHIKLVVSQSATDGNQGTAPDGRLSVIPEEDEELEEEPDGSTRGLSSSNRGTDSSDAELDASQERAVYLQPVMVPIVVHPRSGQVVEEETWEVGCVSRICWPFMWLFRKLDNAPDDEHAGPAPLPTVEDSDAEFADDEYSSTGSSVGSVASSTVAPHMALLMPTVRIYGHSFLQPEVRVSSG
ncbi:hypothetical protein N0V84_007961 [Fusarium piperis]|uniref:Uncharacterized protein n=1 Tax=Fusarium piperis TaxID=1435070 RepID=A0A9W8W960_9HYPO|nr:hypothetical protein N0V84_007961 [Fusarium piperis]